MAPRRTRRGPCARPLQGALELQPRKSKGSCTPRQPPTPGWRLTHSEVDSCWQERGSVKGRAGQVKGLTWGLMVAWGAASLQQRRECWWVARVNVSMAKQITRALALGASSKSAWAAMRQLQNSQPRQEWVALAVEGYWVCAHE